MSLMLNSDANPRVSVSNRLERLPSSSYMLKLCGLILIAAFVEAVDVGGIGYLLPVLGKYWHLSKATLGYLVSTSFIGMILGSLVCGSLADRFGRKPALIAAMLTWGIAGVLFAFSWSVESMFVFRFIFGIGMGAQLPVGVSVLSEMVPSKLRAKYIAAFLATLPLGISTAGLITYLGMPYWGWRGVFLVEALLSLWVLVVWKVLPESALWLESKSKYSEADRVIEYIEEKVQKSTGQPLPPVETKPDSPSDKETVKKGIEFLELWTKPYIKIMIMSMIWWSTNMMGFYGLNVWLTTLLVAKGFSVIKSTGFVAAISLGGIPSYFLISYLVEKIGRKWTVVLMAFGTSATAYIYGGASTFAMVIATGLLFQFVQFGYNSVCSIYTPELFSTRLRGSGTGTSYAAGRIGATLGPVIMGYLMVVYGSASVILFAAAINILGGLVVAVLGPETRGKVF